MVNVREVVSSKDKREFLNFPLRLYRESPYFVPPLYMDEKKIFRRDYVYYDTCEAVYYLAERDGETVGRISGILQKAHNEKTGEKRVRFTRFDSIDDREVAKALFDAVEDWARSKNMDIICGPLGFSDLEREGLLIAGFDRLATFEEQYNYEYYRELIEHCGYEKEVDWVESLLSLPEKPDERLRRTADYIMKRYNLHFDDSKDIDDFIKRYADKMFVLLDESYENIYGTVPFTEGMKKMMIENFRMIVSKKYVAVLLDENDEVVCFGLCIPSIARAVRSSDGHLTPLALLKIMKSVRSPEIIDLGLVGVSAAYCNKGVSAAFMSRLMDFMRESGIKYAETNLNLETNMNIRTQWKHFNSVEHKRRRAFIKRLDA